MKLCYSVVVPVCLKASISPVVTVACPTSRLHVSKAPVRFRHGSQTSGRPCGAPHPGLNDAHQHLHPGD